MQARVTRMLASNVFESPVGTTLLGISAASGSVRGFSCTTAPLPPHCHFRRRCSCRHVACVQCLPVARLPLHCALLRPRALARCMDRAWHSCVWPCALLCVLLIGD